MSAPDTEFPDLVKRLLELLGEDPSREGLLRTPQRVARSRAVCLRPKSRICAGVGPRKTSPACSQSSTKAAFSDRKP